VCGYPRIPFKILEQYPPAPGGQKRHIDPFALRCIQGKRFEGNSFSYIDDTITALPIHPLRDKRKTMRSATG